MERRLGLDGSSYCGSQGGPRAYGVIHASMAEISNQLVCDIVELLRILP